MNFSRRLALIFMFATSCIIAGGIVFYFNRKAEVAGIIEKELMATAWMRKHFPTL